MTKPMTIEAARMAEEAAPPPAWLGELQSITGPNRVFMDFTTRLEHSRDRLPLGRFRHRSKQLAAKLPAAVVEPADIDEVRKIVRFANDRSLPIIPYGSGSGVLGGTVPLHGEIVVALRRLNRIRDLDEANFLVRVEAGMNGGAFEAALKERGFTCGHYPQSLDMSTVGGWAACRGSGQSSSRYGNIENMIVGMKVVLPDGELLEIRPAPRRSVGPSIMGLFIGSEGTLGIIVELTLRIWRLPECEIGQVVAFSGIEAGLDALRDVMQAELRPAVARLYDHEESERWGKAVLPSEANPILCILVFSGRRAVAEAESLTAVDICRKKGAVVVDDAPLRTWQKVRFESYSDVFVDAGGFYDTIEIAAAWSALPDLYARIRASVREKHPVARLNAHWSHIYSDGACMYMTVKFPPMPDRKGLPIHADIWEIVTRSCLDAGATISHHHGIGYFRGKWLVEELNVGHKLLCRLKKSLDPQFLMNPGKLGFE